MSSLKEIFYKIVEPLIDEDGRPNICVYLDRDNKLLVDSMSGLDYRQILRHIVTRRVEGALELLFGVDRTTAEGQGTEFSEVYTCGYWKWGQFGKLSENGTWEIGVINYSSNLKIVREWDWHNEFWKKQMGDEIRNCDTTWDYLSEHLMGQRAAKATNPSEGRPEISAEDFTNLDNQI